MLECVGTDPFGIFRMSWKLQAIKVAQGVGRRAGEVVLTKSSETNRIMMWLTFNSSLKYPSLFVELHYQSLREQFLNSTFNVKYVIQNGRLEISLQLNVNWK